MNFLADADREGTYTWSIAERSSEQLSVLGTTRVGPFRGVMSRPSLHDFSVQAPASLRGQTEWIRFQAEQDGEVVNEVTLFLKVQ